MQSVLLALVSSWAEAWLKAEGAEKDERGEDKTLQDFLIDVEGRVVNWSRMLHRGSSFSGYENWVSMNA